jgi:2-C-methyl-D-erythritol 4-phosphate cytidylyltransferase
MNYTEHALIVAAGKGTRFGTGVSKQFIELNGVPVLMHTIQAFDRYSSTIPIVVVLPDDAVTQWDDLCMQHHFDRPVTIASGGVSRSQSVMNGLAMIEGPGLVAIHDGVRPLVTEAIIADSFRQAAAHRVAIAAVSLKESVRRMIGDAASSAEDRARYRLVQTPQTFEVALIKQAYERLPAGVQSTDDATVAEMAGFSVSLFEGSYENIKITTAEDLILAEALLNKRRNNLR